MRFGRMDKRFNQNTYQNIVTTFEGLTGKSINEKEKNLSPVVLKKWILCVQD
jgi:hypothetical protein